MLWGRLITQAAVLLRTSVLLRFRTTDRLREAGLRVVIVVVPLIRVLPVVAAEVHPLPAEWLL